MDGRERRVGMARTDWDEPRVVGYEGLGGVDRRRGDDLAGRTVGGPLAWNDGRSSISPNKPPSKYLEIQPMNR